MKDKISTFKAMDFLNCNLKWINYSVEHIKGHQEALEHFIEKLEIEKDFEGTDAEFLIKDYLFILDLFINRTKDLSKTVDEYLNGRGISNTADERLHKIIRTTNNA